MNGESLITGLKLMSDELFQMLWWLFVHIHTISLELSVRRYINPSTPCCTVSEDTFSFPTTHITKSINKHQHQLININKQTLPVVYSRAAPSYILGFEPFFRNSTAILPNSPTTNKNTITQHIIHVFNLWINMKQKSITIDIPSQSLQKVIRTQISKKLDIVK